MSEEIAVYAPVATSESAADAAFRRRLDDACDEMVALLLLKRRAYGANNLLRFGPIGIAVRASDKLERLANMLQKGEEIGGEEGIEDAWMDLIGYGLLGLLDYRERARAAREGGR